MIGVETRIIRVGLVIVDATYPVKAKAVDMILPQPEADDVLKIARCLRIKVIPVDATPHIDGRRRMVKKRIPVRPFLAVVTIHGRVHLVVRVLAPGMVKRNVNNHCNTVAVTFVDELLEVVRAPRSYWRCAW